MHDASVGFLAIMGASRKKFLDYLENMVSNNSFLDKGKLIMSNLARIEALNPEADYVMTRTTDTWYAGEATPSLTYAITAPDKGIFAEDALTSTNWTLDMGTSELTLDEITLSADKSAVTFAFTGTAVAGDISISGSDGVAINSKAPEDVTYTVFESIAQDTAYTYEFETASTVVATDVDPSIVLTVASPTGGLFTSAAETLSNWTIDAGDTGLTVASASLNVAETELTVAFTGTAAEGTITLSGNADVVANGVEPVPFIFTVTAS